MQFLLLDENEAFFGGAAGGGKSEALLMGALMYVRYSGYNAILFRRTYQDLSLPEALMDRAFDWLMPSDAEWDNHLHCWRFPSGARLSFGYLDAKRDRYRYQSAAFQYIGFDELTQFREDDYRYLFSRLRRLEGVDLPLRMRSASNPGGMGHEWVKRRFLIEGSRHGRIFIPARLEDNPYIDQASYIASLNELDPITRARLLYGDWSARDTGGMFRRHWFPIITSIPVDFDRVVRFWDLAATKPKDQRDPDYTAGVLMGLKDDYFYIIDVKRVRETPQNVERLIKQTAYEDDTLVGPRIRIYLEEEPGSAGKYVIQHYSRVLRSFAFYGHRTTGSKEDRAAPVSSQAEAGNIKLVQGTWITSFLDELEAFPFGAHDDQVDALSGAFQNISQMPRPPKVQY
jgi:predicted phage terminase large subunit-like protein